LEAFYKPLREVGGDYFDVIELPANRTLFALADVSGKGIPAALLAANIQALVRSIASVESTPLALAKQINKHLSRYTPSDRFATAVFIVLSRDSGELTYVNAGHNASILFSSGSTTFLEATGPPLGLFVDAEYETRTAVISRGSTLLIFTDGLTDSIQGEYPENRLRDAFAESAGRTMANLKSLVDPKFNEDDVTILLVKRIAGSLSSGASAKESYVQKAGSKDGRGVSGPANSRLVRVIGRVPRCGLEMSDQVASTCSCFWQSAARWRVAA
jgi:sigma-B regulation protein RsbU (phosphoserine phosphatase)